MGQLWEFNIGQWYQSETSRLLDVPGPQPGLSWLVKGVLMSAELGNIYPAGDKAPESGSYKLINDEGTLDESIVVAFEKGETMPVHPRVGQNTRWRFIRVGENTWSYREDLP